jgi:diadenosine tetraphosphate (Ap4A) HIT family hydrolase
MESPFYEKEKITENDHAFAVYDKHPVSEGHTLVVPKKEVADLFELGR